MFSNLAIVTKYREQQSFYDNDNDNDDYDYAAELRLKGLLCSNDNENEDENGAAELRLIVAGRQVNRNQRLLVNAAELLCSNDNDNEV